MAGPAEAARTPGRQARRRGRIRVRPRAGQSHPRRSRLFDRQRRLRRRRPHDRRADAHAGRHRRRAAFHPNEQWIYILEGTFRARIGDQEIEAKPGSVVFVPADTIHTGGATPDADVVFFTVKDASHSLHGIKAA